MCCSWLAENTGCKNSSAHHRTTLSGFIFARKACNDNRKKNLLDSNISSTCSNYMANFGPLTAEICSLIWGTPANIDFASHRRPTKLCTMFDRLVGWYTIYTYTYIFSGALAPHIILPGAKSLCVQVLRSPVLAVLLHGTPAAVVSQTAA